jgi:hypothetical protein
VVHVFDLAGHPTATRAYAWSSPIEGSTKRRFFAVLHTVRINSPLEAVRARDRRGTEAETMTKDIIVVSIAAFLVLAGAGKPANHANGGTIGFSMSGPEQAQAWHKAGVANGGTSIEDPPGGAPRGRRADDVSCLPSRSTSCARFIASLF